MEKEDVKLGISQKPEWVDVMVFQLRTAVSDWEKQNKLYSLFDIEQHNNILKKVLKKAGDANVDVLVFPELSIPKECIPLIREWSMNFKSIIIAGTHYELVGDSKVIAKCPVIFNGDIYYTEKINPAPAEKSSIPMKGVDSGEKITIFKNTPIGDFAVLICADNLTPAPKNLIREENLDFWIIPASQRKSKWHHNIMESDVTSSRRSQYIIYANNKIEGLSDGQSSFFGPIDDDVISELSSERSSNNYRNQIIALNDKEDYFIIKANIEHKRTYKKTFPEDGPNIRIVETGCLIPIPKTTTKENPANISAQLKLNENVIESFHLFTLEKYLKKRMHFNENDFELIFRNYSSLYKSIITIKKGSDTVNTSTDEILFRQIEILLKKSKSQIPLFVKCSAGYGKTAFLSTLYMYLYYKFKNKESEKLPIYISLHYYNKFIYPKSRNFFSQAAHKLREDTTPIFSYLQKHKEQEIILIIDGADEFHYPKVDLDNHIFNMVDSLPAQSQIIGLRSHVDKHTQTYRKEKKSLLKESPEVEIEFNKINVKSQSYQHFIESFSNLESLLIGDSANLLTSYITNKVNRFKMKEIDFFHLFLFSKGFQKPFKYDTANSLGELYGIYIEECNLDIKECAELAFKMFNRPKDVLDEEKNNRIWWKIQKHDSLRDYLAAYNIVEKLIEYSRGSDDVFNFVYPYELNSFCKEIINENIDNQVEALRSIKKLFNSAKLTAKTHFCYLLGRFEDEDVKKESISFLKQIEREVSEEIVKRIPLDSTKKLKGENKKYLLYYRTICISLICLEDNDASSNYIKHLINNKYFDNLNRGFHLEYYEDITFSPASPDSLNHEDSLADFSKTFDRLHSKLSMSLATSSFYPLFQIELYTLCSLAQHRQANALLEEEKRIAILELTKNALKQNHNLCNELSIYLRFVKDRFSVKGKFKVASFVRDFYALKKMPRAGWVERNVINPESVASHVYGALLLAYIHLPSNLEEESADYCKDDILRMLLVHDLGETYIGDLTPKKKTSIEEKKEQQQLEYLNLIGTYDGLSSKTNLLDLYNNFTYNETNINCVIAREIDKLDNLLQLYLYNEDGQVVDFEYFRNDLKSKIKTDIGLKIMNQIEDLFN